MKQQEGLHNVRIRKVHGIAPKQPAVTTPVTSDGPLASLRESEFYHENLVDFSNMSSLNAVYEAAQGQGEENVDGETGTGAEENDGTQPRLIESQIGAGAW